MRLFSYDPGIKDREDLRFTSLSDWDNLPKVSMLRMGNGVDFGSGLEVLDLDKPLDLEKISVGDLVLFGNSRGIITEVLKSIKVIDLGFKKLPIGSVVGISVKRMLNYLSVSDRLNPVASGYDVSGDGITMTYKFYQGVDIGEYKNGGGALFMYPGSFYVYPKNKVGNMPSVSRLVNAFQSKY